MSDAPVVVTGVAVDHAVVGAPVVVADEAAEPSVRVTSADLHRLTGYSLDALISKAEVDLSSSGAAAILRCGCNSQFSRSILNCRNFNSHALSAAAAILCSILTPTRALSGLDDAAVDALTAHLGASNTPALVKFSLAGNPVSDNSAAALVRALGSHGGAPQLEELDLGGPAIGRGALGAACVAALAEVLPVLPRLHTLRLSRQALSDDDVLKLAAAVPPQLTTLELLRNAAGAAAARALVGAFCKGRPPSAALVDVVELLAPRESRLDLKKAEISDADLELLFASLPARAAEYAHSPPLESVDLSLNALTSIGCLAGANLAKAHTLLLSHNSLGAPAARELAAAMPSLPGLRRLSLSGNKLGDDGAVAISSALCHVPELRLLELKGCAIGDDGGAAFAAALEGGALAAPGGEAVLADNEMGDRALAAIAAALKVAPATKSLQSLELQGNSFTVGGGMLKKTPPAVKAIEEACKRGKVRVHLKKQGGGTL